MCSKVKTTEELYSRLVEFSGACHSLHSAVAVSYNGEVVWEYVDTAYMNVRSLPLAWINTYIEECGHNVLSSVGGYHYEGMGIQLFDSVKGDYHTILGMPLVPLLQFLRTKGMV